MDDERPSSLDYIEIIQGDTVQQYNSFVSAVSPHSRLRPISQKKGSEFRSDNREHPISQRGLSSVLPRDLTLTRIIHPRCSRSLPRPQHPREPSHLAPPYSSTRMRFSGGSRVSELGAVLLSYISRSSSALSMTGVRLSGFDSDSFVFEDSNSTICFGV